MLQFTKMSGAGNDFVMIDNRAGNVRLTAAQIAKICDRHRGVGADGILLIERAIDGADFRMRYYNRDGGEAEMCGNGARCFARFAQRVAGVSDQVSFETPAGLIKAELEGEAVKLTMSEPRDFRSNMQISVGNRSWTAHFINTGVPHVVIPVMNLDAVEVQTDGASIRRHPSFAPAGANVNFLEKRDEDHIAIRTYERGVEEETLACGTGVVASALIFAATEQRPGPVSVLVRGGNELMVNFERRGEQFTGVTLTGPAEFVFEGQIEL
jgi:diaminopimelate epimerase